MLNDEATNEVSRRTGLKMLAALSALGVTGVSGFAETDARKPSDETIRDAYVYLLGRVLVLRQEQIDRGGDGFTYNQIKYNPLGSADFVNPTSTLPILRHGSLWTNALRLSWKCLKSRAAITRLKSWTSGEKLSATSTSEHFHQCHSENLPWFPRLARDPSLGHGPHRIALA
jgi:hypothetical protein